MDAISDWTSFQCIGACYKPSIISLISLDISLEIYSKLATINKLYYKQQLHREVN